MHTTLVSACMILKNVSCTIFEHFQAFNLSGPYREWNTGYNERKSGFSTERETWFCEVWDILMTEGLFLVRALFINSVELNSDVLPTKFCSIMTVWGRREKKKSWKFSKGYLHLYLHMKRGKTHHCCVHIVLTANFLCNLSACCLCTILRLYLTFKINFF